MTTTAPVLKCVKRDRSGTRYARRLRQSGMTPAIVYGHGREPISVAVNAEESIHHIHAGEKVFSLEIEGEKPDTCLLKALQYDHLGTDIIHIDFARVSMDERVEVTVPVHLLGEAVGLKVSGAILERPSTEITIECQVTNIPEFVEVDITELEAGESYHAGNAPLPGAEMKLMSDHDAILARIEVRKRVLTEEEAAAAEAEGATEEGGEAAAESGSEG